MDSDFQKQHTYYNVKETLPIDISQDNITPLISSISKDKKKKTKTTCFSSQPFHKLRAQLELHGMSQIFQAGAKVRPLPTRNSETHGDAGPVRISKCEFRQDKRVWSHVPPCPAVIVEVCGRSC